MYEPTLIFAGFTALLSIFLDFCFREGAIFETWLDWWASWWFAREAPEIYESYIQMSDEEVRLFYPDEFDSVRELIFENVQWWFFKPLGYCTICFNVWLSIFLSPALLYWLGFSFLGLFCILVAVLLSNLTTRIFLRFLD